MPSSEIDHLSLSELSISTTGGIADPEEMAEFERLIEEAEAAAQGVESTAREELAVRRDRFLSWLGGLYEGAVEGDSGGSGE